MSDSTVLLSTVLKCLYLPFRLRTSYRERVDLLKQALVREYTSFFSPFESEFYAADVEFRDPLTELRGTEAYRANVGMLSGQNMFGKVLFRDASILLHKVEETGPQRLRTRWTLRFTFQALPWRPGAVFTGVSDYTLDERGYVKKQQDYWDSLNLVDGSYVVKDRLAGLKDFTGQLARRDEADAAMGAEVPYVLLRRAATYEVRRYPGIRSIKTVYEARPEGYARLGSYAEGANKGRAKMSPLTPSLVIVGKTEPARKVMVWPLDFERPRTGAFEVETPAATEAGVDTEDIPGAVIAVSRFQDPATEQFVKYHGAKLQRDVERDGLVPCPEADDSYTVAQYNAIYSLSVKRNEVWLRLSSHDWL